MSLFDSMMGGMAGMGSVQTCGCPQGGHLSKCVVLSYGQSLIGSPGQVMSIGNWVTTTPPVPTPVIQLFIIQTTDGLFTHEADDFVELDHTVKVKDHSDGKWYNYPAANIIRYTYSPL